ncbi:MAG: sigma-70 family RNA polymerase sigma factor [Phycisphaerae bacterium]|mgnify:CR=1 FL=1|nr:sigma-70 family RNA polymerase sigma factor [Phycisphaerae bacterium]
MSSPRTTDLNDDWARRVSRSVAIGARDAVAELYERPYNRMFWIVRERTRRDDDFACDCVHDAWMRILRGMAETTTMAALDAWLARVAITSAIDRIKREGSRARHESAVIASDAASTEQSEFDRLDAELAALSCDGREALHLRVARDHTMDVVAETLEISVTATESRVRRALRRLRARWKEVPRV